MNVQSILRNKGAEVFTISAEASITEALGTLARRNVGALLVHTDTDPAAGILSERDIVRWLHNRGAQALELTVADCMTPHPKSCAPETTIDEVMGGMTEMRVRHMPVMRGSRLVGVISIGDVVKFKIEQAEREAADLKEYIAG
jgi:CBS domain-containing protein